MSSKTTKGCLTWIDLVHVVCFVFLLFIISERLQPRPWKWCSFTLTQLAAGNLALESTHLPGWPDMDGLQEQFSSTTNIKIKTLSASCLRRCWAPKPLNKVTFYFMPWKVCSLNLKPWTFIVRLLYNFLFLPKQCMDTIGFTMFHARYTFILIGLF